MFKEGDKVHFKGKPDHTYTVERVSDGSGSESKGSVILVGTKTWYAESLFEPEVTPAEIMVGEEVRCPHCESLNPRMNSKCWDCKGVLGKTDRNTFMEVSDMVNRPGHYQTSLGVEVIDIIDEFFSDNYNLGNVLKYLLRADKKGNRQEDLEKALVYLNREVEHGR